MRSFLLSDWSPAIKRCARSLAVAIAIAYAAGYASGCAIHRWNDRLAAAVSGRQLQPQPRPIRQQQAAPPLASLTVIELRKMARAAGHRSLARSGRKADLLAVLA